MQTTSRRRVIRLAAQGALGALGALAMVGLPATASSRRVLPAMTDGPFYPSRSYRSGAIDWDADLTLVRGRAPDGQPMPRAVGELLDLSGRVHDTNGRPVDGAEIEIWQCDAYGSYRHPRGAGDRVDAGFQGFGSARSDAAGAYRFRTIRPVPYPGRTPHIHVKLRHASFGETTSQLFVAGDPGNAKDFLWRRLELAERNAAEMRLVRSPSSAGVIWQVDKALIVG